MAPRPIHPLAQLSLRSRTGSLVLPGDAVDSVGARPILGELVPVRQNRRNLGRVGELVHILEVLLGDGEGLRRHVGDVLANKLGRIYRCLVDLLEKERSKRLHTRPKEGRMEGHVNATERDRCKATLELQGGRLLERRLSAALDDLLERTLGLVDVATHLLNVDLLLLEEVGDAREGVKSPKITGGNVLHVCDVVVDNLKEPASLLGDAVNNELQSLLIEGLGDSAGVDGAHGVVGASGRVTLDSDLHRQTTVEDNRHQTLDRHDLRQGSKGRVLAQGVTSESAVSRHKTLGLHVLKAGLLHEGKSGLSELSSRKQAGGLDASIGSNGLESHGHVVLANGLATRATEVNGELLGVVLDDVLVGAVPDLLGDVAAGVQLHTHTLFLRTLAGEDVGGHGLLDLCLTKKDLLLGFLVAGLDLDDLAARDHTNVLKLDLKVVVGKNHADQRGVEAADTTNIVLSSPSLNQATDGSTGVHAVGDGAREGGVVGKHTRDVDGIVVTRDTGVVLVSGRGTELERSAAAERDGVLKVQGLVERGTVALEVINYGVAIGLASLVVNTSDLDDLLGGKLKQNLALGGDAAIHRLGLVAVKALQTEGERLSEEVEVAGQVISVEPLLRLKNSYIFAGGQVQLDGGFHLALEGVLVVGVGTAVQELRGDVHDSLAIAVDGTADLDHFAGLLVDDSVDLGGGRNLVTLLKGLGAGLHAERVGQVDQLQQVTVNSAREDGLGNSLPANDDGKVHGGVNSLPGTLDKSLASVANGVDEVVDVFASNGSLATVELAANVGLEVESLITEPRTPVELLDAVVATLHDLADGSVASLGVVGELERKRDGLAKGRGVLDHADDNLVLTLKLDLDDIDVLVVTRLLFDDNLGLLRVLGVVDLDKEATSGSKNALNGVGLELLPLNNNL
ncbi:LOW QUALITY PROTEIN: unnamed protein product [Colletotrichum tofieldiae]|nr:LOW QUALITY PROTEIN: unnamed protein product [Colletotrichum tofieldiae]